MEPRSTSSQDALSNLQRKVLKNTFVNNSNDLRLRDETVSKPSFSDLLRMSKSRADSRPVDTSGLSKVLEMQGVSFSQSIDKLFQTTKVRLTQDLELSNLQSAPEDMAARLQETLLKAEAGSIVLLPPQHITVGNLRVCNPLTIKGSPGTILEVTNGSIIIDFNSHSKESLLGRATDRVEICELSLIFNADRRCLDSKAPVALFIVDTPNSFLEVRDCDIKSVSQEAHNVSIDSSGPYMIQDVCLWVNGFSSRKEGTIERGFCCVFMTSCNVTGFYEFTKGGSNCKVHIDKCHISDCGCNALTLLNPKEAIVTQSVIERCQGSSIDIRLKTDTGSRVPSRSGSLTTSQEASVRTISITGNDIRANGAYGVTIWSEHQAAVPISISISKNKVMNCRKEGIAVRHLSLTELSILSNDISVNQGTGCWLQKVYKLYPESSIGVSLNRSFDSHSGYGIYLYDTAGVLDSNECFRNSRKM